MDDVIIFDQLDPSTAFEKARHLSDISWPPVAADPRCYQAGVDEIVAASFDCGREFMVEVTPIQLKIVRMIFVVGDAAWIDVDAIDLLIVEVSNSDTFTTADSATNMLCSRDDRRKQC